MEPSTTPVVPAVSQKRSNPPRSCKKRRILAQLPCPNENDGGRPTSRRKTATICRWTRPVAEAEVMALQKHGEDSPATEPPCIYQSVPGRCYDVADLKAFIRMLPPLDELERPRCPIPKKQPGAPKVSLVLDLDETLVHSSTIAIATPDYVFPVQLRDASYSVYVRLRPHFFEFMERMTKAFEVIVFTASQQVYAEALLDLLDPHKRFIQHRVFRDSCVVVDGNYMKDLRVLGRDLSRTVIVDNSPISFCYQLDNGVPIESWFSLPQDRELLELAPFLEGISQVDDVRPHVRERFWESAESHSS